MEMKLSRALENERKSASSKRFELSSPIRDGDGKGNRSGGLVVFSEDKFIGIRCGEISKGKG